MRRNRHISTLLAALAALGVVVVVVSGYHPSPVSVTPSLLPTAVASVAVASAALNEWGPFAQLGLQGRAEPDPVVTPGATNPSVTQATIGQTICVKGWTATVRPPQSYTGPLKVRQIAQYGYTDTATTSYEEDHLIPLEVGGSPADPANLWPEPKVSTLSDGTSVGFPVKDRFENFIKAAVCANRMTLIEGQHELASDWVAYWMKAGRL